MASITLSCGCHLTAGSVLAMCAMHACELAAKQRTEEERYREYVNAMSLACAEASAIVRKPAQRRGDVG